MQDATRKHLYHRVGMTENDWKYSYYVFPNFTYFLSEAHCTKLPEGYDDFLKRMGFLYIRKQREEEIFLNGRFRGVIVYEGEPPENVTVNELHPFLIRGYSSPQRISIHRMDTTRQQYSFFYLIVFHSVRYFY
ncbi:hypothetical protein DICVIV_11751 [Dictyocaulus viviparus]|uniref:Uncharacterized protein n=1 Tax=Dictyocaulus viviparus TaxID=29172 RepID=A0A0D8XF07_DICVI|nr:hypothetical protein DICVIV_11751 [Dictyocaulus viviparus]